MKVKVIGCGGIGSYFAEHVERLIELKQIIDMTFDFYDDDKVELKNILYQNFETTDIDSFKTEALSLRYYNLNFIEQRLKLEDLIETDLVILCADNNKIRKEAWEAWEKYKIPFLDSRANGRAVGIYSSDTENYTKTISDDEKPSSCQNPFQLAKKEIEYGNVVIASVLAQVTLNYSRSKRLPPDFAVNL